MLGGAVPAGQPLEIEGAPQPGAVTKNGLVLYGSDGKAVSAAEATAAVFFCLAAGLCVLKVLCLLHSCW